MNNIVSPLRCLILLALVGTALAGCSVSSPQVTYYSLLGREAATIVGHRNDQLVLSVGPVTIPDILKKSQIATGGTDGRYQLSEYHRWAGSVDREVARALAEQLAGRLGTEQIIIFPGDERVEPNLQITVEVVAMDGDLGKEAKLTVRWTMIDPKGAWAPIIRRSQFIEQPAGNGYDAWVTAQQRNLGRLSEEIAALIKAQRRL
jgi:uncharacterized lipoprotein YmbA